MTSHSSSSSSSSSGENAAAPSSTSSSSSVSISTNIFQSIMSRSANNSPLSSAHYTAEAALHRPIPLPVVSGAGRDGTAVATVFTNTPAGSLHVGNDINNNNLYASSSSSSSPVPLPDDMSKVALTMRALPYPQPWTRHNATPAELPPNFDWFSESCGSKAAIGVIGGGVMGLLMGVFMGALTDMTPPVTVIEGKEVPQAPLREQVRTTMRATADKSLYWCRQFAFITGVFGGTECLVEKYRGKHDVWNAVVSGCVTGAALQAKAGPQASALGCGGFAAFSLVIDSVMGTHS